MLHEHTDKPDSSLRFSRDEVIGMPDENIPAVFFKLVTTSSRHTLDLKTGAPNDRFIPISINGTGTDIENRTGLNIANSRLLLAADYLFRVNDTRIHDCKQILNGIRSEEFMKLL